MVSAKSLGASQDFLMKMYRIYVRSKLDYGCIVYSSASNSELKKLDVVSSDALRIATGAFRSSPVQSLYVVAEEMEPSQRREYLTIRFYLKIRASLRNPTNKCITNRNETLFRNNNQSPFLIRCLDIQHRYNLPRFIVKPDFSCQFHSCTILTYAIPNPPTNQEMAQHPKETTPPVIYRQNFLRLKSENYQDFYHIYTDGSKSSQGVGAAAVSDGPACVATLPPEASIYAAEAHALQMAVNYIDRLTSTNPPPSMNYVIFSDSRGVIQSLHNRNNHPVIRYILHNSTNFKTKTPILKYAGYRAMLASMETRRPTSKLKKHQSATPSSFQFITRIITPPFVQSSLANEISHGRTMLTHRNLGRSNATSPHGLPVHSVGGSK